MEIEVKQGAALEGFKVAQWAKSGTFRFRPFHFADFVA
jgi:hypothetical protein